MANSGHQSFLVTALIATVTAVVVTAIEAAAVVIAIDLIDGRTKFCQPQHPSPKGPSLWDSSPSSATPSGRSSNHS